MRVLIIGGSGFLGIHLAEELAKKGYKINILDIKKPNNLNKNVKFFNGDITKSKPLIRALKNCKIVFHLGGISDIKYSINNPYKTIKINVMGTMNILDLCVKKKIKKLIFASSIYVKSTQGGFYKVSKQCCESVIKEYSKRFGLNYCIIRYGSVYGVGSSVNNGITKILNTYIKKKKFHYDGTIKAKRRFIFVKDAINTTIKTIDKKFNNKSVLITGYKFMKIKNVMKTISEILKTNLKPSYKNKQELGHYNISPYSLKKEKTENLYIENKKNFRENIQNLYEHLLRNKK